MHLVRVVKEIQNAHARLLFFFTRFSQTLSSIHLHISHGGICRSLCSLAVFVYAFPLCMLIETPTFLILAFAPAKEKKKEKKRNHFLMGNMTSKKERKKRKKNQNLYNAPMHPTPSISFPVLMLNNNKEQVQYLPI
ncbi:hypothetical protein V8C37DRAFT_241097 [Trichoderma ceciliae]